MPEQQWVTGDYLDKAIQARQRPIIIERVVRRIRKSGIDFDAIAFTGLSGALIAPSVADLLKKPIIAVRKEKTPHSSRRIEGFCGGKSYIILDDCRDTGNTILRIYKTLKKTYRFEQYNLAGIFLYSADGGLRHKTDYEIGEYQRIHCTVPMFY